MASFDQAIPETLRICQDFPGFSNIAGAVLIRDLQGRIRLVVASDNSGLDLSSLSENLKNELGQYFYPPIVDKDSGEIEQRRLANNIFDKAKEWPESWTETYEDPITGESRSRYQFWKGISRTLSKEAWLQSGPVTPPWPMNENTPSIVSFYSFKGGVGRTTLLACIAVTLAQENKEVVVVDLDLEGPGLGGLFNVEVDRGVIDYVLDSVAANNSDLDGFWGEAHGIDAAKKSIKVIPAVSKFDWSYIEKLARLDYASWGPGAEERSPIEKSLRSLLKAIKKKFNPDYILLDSRSGLHDLGGLSLHALAHVEVLITRRNPQDLAGTWLTLEALIKRKPREELNLLVVQSSTSSSVEREKKSEEIQILKEAIYEKFYELVDLEDEQPDIEDDQSQHYPRYFSRFQELERIQCLSDVPARFFQETELLEISERIKFLARSSDVEESQQGEDGEI